MIKKKFLIGAIVLSILVGCTSSSTTVSKDDTKETNANIKNEQVDSSKDKGEKLKDEVETKKEEAKEVAAEGQGGFYINGLYFDKIMVYGVTLPMDGSASGLKYFEDYPEISVEAESRYYEGVHYEDLELDVSKMTDAYSYDVNISDGEHGSKVQIQLNTTDKRYDNSRAYDEAAIVSVRFDAKREESHNHESPLIGINDYDLGYGLKTGCTKDDFLRVLGEPTDVGTTAGETGMKWEENPDPDKGSSYTFGSIRVYFFEDGCVKQVHVWNMPNKFLK